jgi:fucose permease
MYEISDSGEDKPNYKQLFSQKVFWLIIIIMLCSGAAELAVSQWASTFVEQGFHLSKSTGDLIGVGGFAAFMGLSRVIYSKCANRISPMCAIALSACLCIVSYLMIGLSNSGVIGLMGCVICGFSVGILWPGTLSMASEKVVSGGTTMFALCALGGDIGCTSGPALAGFMTGVLGGDLRLGILCSIIFPILLIVALGLLKEDKKFKGR